MRLNKYLALHTALSRRAADTAIEQGRVQVNGAPAVVGQAVSDTDNIKLDNHLVVATTAHRTILLHKPVGYICSRDGQGSPTIYDLLPESYRHLNPVGRLDKDSSGLLLLTNDGDFANQLAHPRYQKEKQYEVALDKPLNTADLTKINQGLTLEDGISHLQISPLEGNRWLVVMSEGRNRQIRRTFAALSYNVITLHRIRFGSYKLGTLKPGSLKVINNSDIISHFVK